MTDELELPSDEWIQEARALIQEVNKLWEKLPPGFQGTQPRKVQEIEAYITRLQDIVIHHAVSRYVEEKRFS